MSKLDGSPCKCMMLPNMISVCLLLLVTLTSATAEGLSVEEGTVQQPAVYIDVEIIRKPLTEEWSEEMCAGELDINGCIDKIEETRIQKTQNKAWKNKLKAKWRARKTKWQQRIDKLRKVVRERQSQSKKPKKTKDVTREKGEETTWAWKMLQTILKGETSITHVKETIGKQMLRQMKSEKRKGKRWAWKMLLALLEGSKTISEVREIIEKQKVKKLQSEDDEEVNEEKTVEEAVHLEKLEEEECKGVSDSKACKKEMEKINDGKKTTWAWKMLQVILKGEKSIAQVKETIGEQKLKQMKSEKRKGKRWAWRMLLALLEGSKTISEVREIIKKQKSKKLQSEDGEEVNEEKTVEEAVHLEKLEEEECKGVSDSKACKREMEKINDGKKTTWAWKMLQVILKGEKSIAQVKETIGEQKLKQMKSEKRKGKRWAWRMLLALLEGSKTISEVREIIKKQKSRKLQSEDDEEVNEEKTVEEAVHLEKLEEEECKGVSDSKACKREMEKINDGKKTTWAWKMLQVILKGEKSIAQVKETIGEQKLKQMKSEKRKGKRWAWRMLLALLEGSKTISQVREIIKKQKSKKLQSEDGEEVNEEKTVEEAVHLEKLEEEECKGVSDSKACKGEMEKINDGKKTTWAWKMLQVILKGEKSIAQVKETIGEQKLKQMQSEKRKGKRWAWRMLLALLEGSKTISEVREIIKKQKSRKLQSEDDEEVNEEKTVEEAVHLEKLEEEECKGVSDSKACKREMEKINDGKKTTWAWKMLQVILKGEKSIAQVKETIGEQKLKQMKSEKRKGKRWAWRMLLALLEGSKTISEVREIIKKQKSRKLQSEDDEEVNEEKTVEEAVHLEKLEEEECKGVSDSKACKREMEKINDGKKTTWAWKMLQVILKGEKSIAQVKETIGEQKLKQMQSEKRKGKRWAWRMLLALLEGSKTISEVREIIKKQKSRKLQSEDDEEVNEEKTVEEAVHLEKLEEEECKGVSDSKACKKEMEKINDGKKTTWAWKMLQVILKGEKSIAQVKETIGEQKLKQMKSEKRKGKRWAWRMLLALLEGSKTISQVREIIKKQKSRKLQSEDDEEVNEEKTVEEADHLEKLEEEECRDVADSKACKKEMEEINDGKKTTWAWKMLLTILKGEKSIAQVKKTIGEQKLRQMKSEKGRRKRWAWRMLLALLEGAKTVSQVKEKLGDKRFKKLLSQNGEEVSAEKTVEEALHLEKLEEEECKNVADIEGCKKEMEKINDGEKSTWAWKMLQTILKGEKTIAQVKETIGEQKLRQMKSEKGRRKRWSWRMLLALLDGTKTITQVKKLKVSSETGAEIAEECKSSSNVDACVMKSKKAKDSRKERPYSGLSIIKNIVNKLRGNRKNSAQGNGKNSAEGKIKNSAEGNGENVAGGKRTISAEGNRKSSARGDRKNSAEGNRNTSARGNGKNPAQGIRENSAGGKKRNSPRGNRKNSAEGNGENVAGGKRTISAEGNRKSSARGNRKNSVEGNRKNSVEGNKKNSAQGNRKNPAQGNTEKYVEGNRENFARGNRKNSGERTRKNSAQENRKNSDQGNRNNSARGKGKDSARRKRGK